MTFTERMKEFIKERGADLVGISSIDRWDNAPEGHRPQNFLANAQAVVVLGVRIPLAAAENWEKIKTPYHVYGHGILNFKLSFLEYDLCRFLEDHGFRALPMASRDPHYDIETMMTSGLSHRHAAVAAGLGEFGWHNSVITPEFGPRVRFTSTITDAPLEPTPLYHGKSLCSCAPSKRLCVKVCPFNILDREEEQLSIGSKLVTMAKLSNQDKQRCRWAEHGLIKEAGAMSDVQPPEEIHAEHYLEAQNLRHPVQKARSNMYGGIYYCGKCIHICPVGKKEQVKQKAE